MTTDTIPIELNQAERHTLVHLLDHFIRQRSWEVIKCAYYSPQIYEGAEQARLLAQLHSLTEDGASLPVADLDAHRANLVSWALEAETTVDEHEATVVEADEDRRELGLGGDHREVNETIDHERLLILQDYAHACVCEKIVGQIDAAREPVVA
jgi:hypothetical protein